MEWRGLTTDYVYIESWKDFELSFGYLIIEGGIRVAIYWGDRFINKSFATKSTVMVDNEEVLLMAKDKAAERLIIKLKERFKSKQYRNYRFEWIGGVRWIFTKERDMLNGMKQIGSQWEEFYSVGEIPDIPKF